MDSLPQEPKKTDRVPIKSLRTYQGDVEEAIGKNKYSATTIFVAEQKKRLENPTPRVAEKHINPESRNKFFTVLGITLFLLGVLIVYSVYYVRSNEKVVIEQKTKALIEFSSEKDSVTASSTRDALIDKILTEKTNFKQPVNSVMFLNTTDSKNNPLNVSAIIGLLAPHMPLSLVRSFDARYMIGILSFDTNEAFIILTVSDYASSYAGMLKWEKDIVNDLGTIFEINQNTATTTNIFSDEAIRNKDLRILKNAKGETTLLYSFIDKKTLVITKNENIFNSILAKYLTSQNTR